MVKMDFRFLDIITHKTRFKPIKTRNLYSQNFELIIVWGRKQSFNQGTPPLRRAQKNKNNFLCKPKTNININIIKVKIPAETE